jgi:putative NIF3 family GTP cyclohydrolase 1 type 2
VVPEVRIESVFDRRRRRQVLEAMRTAHPYQEPAFDVVELAVVSPDTGSLRGSGRIGQLPSPVTLRTFADSVAAALPSTAHGVRVGGDPARPLRTVAVASGAGDFLLDEVLHSGADAYLTSDLRHHRAGEFLEHAGPALIDVAHWAAEWTWLPVVAEKLRRASADRGDTVELHVSTRVTDPWTARG